MVVLGVDGWRGAWVGALLESRTVTLMALPDIAAVLAVHRVHLVAIDMPIGLADNGVRACDVEARRLLVGAGSSVFPAPLRRALACEDYATACVESREASGKALSMQTWNLVPAIRALDDALGAPPTDRVVEVHPELSFRALDPAVRDRTGSARGTVQRLRALRAVMDVEEALAAAPAGIPVVDALDSCAAAWSARRLAGGRGECVGTSATDARGRPMRICW